MANLTTYDINQNVSMTTRTTKKLTVQRVWRNLNGTWSHHRDSRREWADYNSCMTDLRFADEWAGA